MSINTVKGTLIQPDVNNDNNTTDVMKVDTLYSNIITDGIATIENGFISNLIEPTNDNQIATKFYVDNSGGGGGATGPVNSLQYNVGGVFAGSANLTLSNIGLPNATMNLNGTLTNGTLTMSGSQISGLVNPTNPQEAANKNYVDSSLNSLGVITINIGLPTTYTPAQIYNNIINFTNNNNFFLICAADSLPTGPDMSAYLGSEFQLGKTWKTIFRAPFTDPSIPLQTNAFVRFIAGQPSDGNQIIPITYAYFILFASQTMALFNNSVAEVTYVVTDVTPGSEAYQAFVTSYYSNVDSDAQITDRGVLTPTMATSGTNGLSTGTVIYPLLQNPSINSSSPVTYSYSNLQKMLIVRTGLTGPTSDTFDNAAIIVTSSDFLMGGGTFKFWIQNPTLFALTLVPSVGWSFQTGNNPVIPAGHCGVFWVSVVISPPSCIVSSLGTNPING